MRSFFTSPKHLVDRLLTSLLTSADLVGQRKPHITNRFEVSSSLPIADFNCAQFDPLREDGIMTGSYLCKDANGITEVSGAGGFHQGSGLIGQGATGWVLAAVLMLILG